MKYFKAVNDKTNEISVHGHATVYRREVGKAGHREEFDSCLLGDDKSSLVDFG